jgi:hypothetical protein
VTIIDFLGSRYTSNVNYHKASLKVAVKTWKEEFEDIVLSGPPQQVIATSGEYRSKYHACGAKPILQRIWRKE